MAEKQNMFACGYASQQAFVDDMTSRLRLLGEDGSDSSGDEDKKEDKQEDKKEDKKTSKKKKKTAGKGYKRNAQKRLNILVEAVKFMKSQGLTNEQIAGHIMTTTMTCDIIVKINVNILLWFLRP